jgi:glycosyltransferase involved in cell wall biosynthesis
MHVTGEAAMSLSVVVVNYNNSRYLRKALDSIVAQSYRPDEVIVADDCSTDDSCSIVAEYERAHPFVKLIRNVKNLGPSGNRDFGIKAVTSANFVTLDSDDWFERGALEAINGSFCAAGASKTMIVSSFHVVRDEVTPLFTIDTGGFCRLAKGKQLFALAARKRFMPGNQLAMATGLYRSLGGLQVSLRLYEDWEFMLRAAIAGVTWTHSGVVAYSYRKSGTGVSSSAKRRSHAQHLLRVAARSCRAGKCNPFLLAGLADLVIRKGALGLVGGRSQEGFN